MNLDSFSLDVPALIAAASAATGWTLLAWGGRPARWNGARVEPECHVPRLRRFTFLTAVVCAVVLFATGQAVLPVPPLGEMVLLLVALFFGTSCSVHEVDGRPLHVHRMFGITCEKK